MQIWRKGGGSLKKSTIVYKILLTIIIIIITGTVYSKKDQINQFILSNRLKQFSVLYNAFQKIGAQLIMREISFMSQNVEKTNNINEVINKNRRICTRIALKMGMKQDENFRIDEHITDDVYETQYHIKKDQYISCFIRCVSSVEKDDKVSTNFYIALSSDLINDSNESFNHTLVSIKDSLADIGMKASINESIIGFFEGRRQTKDLNNMLNEMFKYLRANKNDVIKESNYVSITGYTPMIGRYIEINGKKTNVNIALRYNSYEQKTYIWLSSPVINKEY